MRCLSMTPSLMVGRQRSSGALDNIACDRLWERSPSNAPCGARTDAMRSCSGCTHGRLLDRRRSAPLAAAPKRLPANMWAPS